MTTPETRPDDVPDDGARVEEALRLLSGEAELVRRLHPPLNVSGVDREHIQAAVVAAKNAYNTSSAPVRQPQRPHP